MMKLPDGNVPAVMVPEPKHDVLRVAVPETPKLPAELALAS